MSGNPRIEFGLSALKTAMLARTGQCTDWDVIRLQATALRCAYDDGALREAVLAFTDTYRGDAVRAGVALQSALHAWLGDLPDTLRHDIVKSANPGTLYDWQKRADLQ